ncbi:tetratricopeptide repeat protein [Enterococcus entomosocium]|jgi:tetratricopeptide (TPR) repeat protein|uniref:tetratricopeptide repeat protein n=1 Tax=Enterococcus TaxID=1350 RepID=UPI0003609EDB|nr:tetratricopeptide repeat protein [Enterococcus faecium 13.SD.W.09]
METYSEKMLKALAAEELAEAQLNFTEALQKDDDETLGALGDELLQIGFLEEAKTLFETLQQRHPENEALLLPLAEIAMEEDQIETAFTYIDQIPPTSEAYLQALLLSADLYQLIGIPEVSEAKLKEAQSLVPEEPLIRFALAELAFSTDRYQEAVDLYQGLLEEDITDISGISIVERTGTSLSMAGKFEEALEYFEASLEDEQTDERLFQTALVYLQLKENEQAIRYLQQLRVMNPQYRALYLYLAEALQEEEQLEEAQRVIEEGIHEDPYQVDFYHFAAENAYRLHDSEAAESFLLKALETGEKEEDTLLTLSNLYLNEERWQEAILAIERMEDNEQPHALWNLAQAFNALEDFDKAAKYYEEANADLHHEPAFMKEYGIFLREEGRLPEALHLLQHYLAHEPGDLEVQSIVEDLLER